MGHGLTADALMGHVHEKSRRHHKWVHEGVQPSPQKSC